MSKKGSGEIDKKVTWNTKNYQSCPRAVNYRVWFGDNLLKGG